MKIKTNPQTAQLAALAKQIVNCRRCPRLVEFRREVAEKKVKRFNDWRYWGKPVPGFGDPNAEVLIIGLAPAAHGANRTGRMFTGDSSGDWLYRALYETGFANQPASFSRDDGLVLKKVFVTAVCRCAPPGNKPLPSEMENCSDYLEKEIELLPNVKVVLCLGQIAFSRYCRLHSLKRLEFSHGKKFRLRDGKILLSSYHPSRQNTNTGRLKWNDWLKVFREVRLIAGVRRAS
ncbi:MAG TPA: uracil-DNA glycosylase [Chitinophagales bacterium]|nr:uracil-DNA glycosylase [Chitinophagales bacterium]